MLAILNAFKPRVSHWYNCDVTFLFRLLIGSNKNTSKTTASVKYRTFIVLNYQSINAKWVWVNYTQLFVEWNFRQKLQLFGRLKCLRLSRMNPGFFQFNFILKERERMKENLRAFQCNAWMYLRITVDELNFFCQQQYLSCQMHWRHLNSAHTKPS